MQILKKKINMQAEAKILRGPHEDLESYLEAVDQLRSNIRFFSSNKSFKSSDGVLAHANNLLAKAILKLEEEFKQLLMSYRFSSCIYILCFFFFPHLELESGVFFSAIRFAFGLIRSSNDLAFLLCPNSVLLQTNPDTPYIQPVLDHKAKLLLQ